MRFVREETWEPGVAEGHTKRNDPRVKTKCCQKGAHEQVKSDELMVSQIGGDQGRTAEERDGQRSLAGMGT